MLRNFLRDRPNQPFLSVMVATFTYSAAGLYTVGESGEAAHRFLSAACRHLCDRALFVSRGSLIFFLDHLAHSIPIDRLMVGIERATIQVLNEEPPGLCPGSGPGEAPGPPVWAVEIRARRHGYMQTIHAERLLPLAE